MYSTFLLVFPGACNAIQKLYVERDLQIRDLKEKDVSLSSLLRKSEMQKAELIHQVKSQVSKAH